jgi:hypothetical protein
MPNGIAVYDCENAIKDEPTWTKWANIVYIVGSCNIKTHAILLPEKVDLKAVIREAIEAEEDEDADDGGEASG